MNQPLFIALNLIVSGILVWLGVFLVRKKNNAETLKTLSEKTKTDVETRILEYNELLQVKTELEDSRRRILKLEAALKIEEDINAGLLRKITVMETFRDIKLKKKEDEK